MIIKSKPKECTHSPRTHKASKKGTPISNQFKRQRGSLPPYEAKANLDLAMYHPPIIYNINTFNDIYKQRAAATKPLISTFKYKLEPSSTLITGVSNVVIPTDISRCDVLISPD